MLLGSRSGFESRRRSGYWGLCFTALQDNSTVGMQKNGSAPAVTLYTSRDGAAWTPFTIGTDTVTLEHEGDKVYFAAGSDGNVRMGSGSSTYNKFVFLAGKVSASGDIGSLLDRDSPPEDYTSAGGADRSYCFRNLFNGAANLKDVSGLVLSAKVLPQYSYWNMFGGSGISTGPRILSETVGSYAFSYMFTECNSLVSAPELPATTLGTYAYNYMFNGCQNLVDPPSELPAPTLEEYSYNYMFQNCGKLRAAPSMDKTTAVGHYCCYAMFFNCTSLTEAHFPAATTSYRSSWRSGAYWLMYSGCTSLTSVPRIPMVSPGERCFRETFKGCTALVTPPDLSGITSFTSWGCCQAMFSGCTSLTATPALPACRGNSCFESMFSGCTSLTTVPGSLGSVLSSSCYAKMFYGCTSLTTTPALPATSLYESCYSEMFSGCTGLTSAALPVLPATATAKSCYASMFAGCTGITTPPVLPATTTTEACYASMFANCTNLASAPSLPAPVLQTGCYSGMFSGCTSLTATPDFAAVTSFANSYPCSSMFLNCTSLAEAHVPYGMSWSCFDSMFKGCTALVNPPELPYVGEVYDNAYANMFFGCTSLASAPSLAKATSVRSGCYSQMFKGCTALQHGPEFPNIPVASGSMCYYMFDGCTGLLNAPYLPATTLAGQCYYYMFNNCTSMTTPMDVLPAKTPGSSAYLGMFSGCRSLTKSPEIMAETANANQFDWDMFRNCTSLTEIRTHYKSWGNNQAWVDKVAANGVFYCPPELGDNDTIARGANRCPAGWTVIDINLLCFTAVSAGATVEMAAVGTAPSVDLEHSVDGLTWSAFVVGTTTVTLAAVGDKVYIRAGSNGNTALATDDSNYNHFVIGGEVSVSGHLTRLLSQSADIYDLTGHDYAFAFLFAQTGETSLDVSNLGMVSTTLSEGCYQGMFDGSTLTTPPALPATTLAESCYKGMFGGCSSLASAPSLLATEMEQQCYASMFRNCTSLEAPPELPGTVLAEGCYAFMFDGCSSLESAPALTAPLASNCYFGMFRGCTALTEAPGLGSTTLASGCYEMMFYGCSSLSLVSVAMTSWTDPELAACTTDWLDGVAAEGTFKCKSALGTESTIERGASKCPAGWTVDNQGFTVDISNEQWRIQDPNTNPDDTMYAGVYESNSNYHVNSGYAKVYIRVHGYDQFTIYIRSYAESTYDYTIAFNPDVDVTSLPAYNTAGVKAHTRGNQKGGTSISDYTRVDYTGLGGGDHYILVVYRKDSSTHSNDDRGYLLVPYQ